MGFFDKFFNKKEEERTEIGFSELDAWLDEEITKSDSELVEETEPILNEIHDLSEEMKEKVLELRDLPYPETLPKRFKKIVRTSRPEYISSMADVLDEIKVGEDIDPHFILDFQTEFSKLLEKIAKISIGPGRYLPLAFEKNLASIQKETKNLILASRKLEEVLKSHDRISVLNKTKSTKRELDVISQDKVALRRQAEGLKEDLARLNADLAKTEGDRERILKNKQLGQLRDRLAAIKEEKAIIEDTIHSNVTPLKRSLRKYRRLAGRLSPEAEDSIDGYIEKPVEHFLSDRHLGQILEDLGKAIDEGKIEIKNPQKVSKTIVHAMEVLKPELVDEYNRLQEDEKHVGDEIRSSSVAKQTKQIELRVGELEHEIKAAGDELKAVDKRRHELKYNIKDMKKRIHDQLDGLNVSVSTGR